MGTERGFIFGKSQVCLTCICQLRKVGFYELDSFYFIFFSCLVPSSWEKLKALAGDMSPGAGEMRPPDHPPGMCGHRGGRREEIGRSYFMHLKAGRLGVVRR